MAIQAIRHHNLRYSVLYLEIYLEMQAPAPSESESGMAPLLIPPSLKWCPPWALFEHF